MKKITLLAVLAACIGAVQAQPYATWSRYREITINTPATVVAPLSKYPVLVRLTDSSVATGANVLTDAMANGADVRFTDSTGMTALSYEIDTWSSNVGAAWVRVPTIPAGGPVKIRMYWGRPGSTTLSNPGGVFDSAGGFVGVWHLGNAAGISPRPNAITGSPAATPANDVGSFGGGAGAYTAPAGQIGNADDLRGTGSRSGPDAGSDYLDIGSPVGFVAGTYAGTNTFTGYNDFSTGFSYSLWVKARTVNVAYTYLIELANGNGCNDNIQVFRPASDARYRYEHCNGTTSGGTHQTPNNTLVNGTWEFYTFTQNGTIGYLYKNGQRVTGPSTRSNTASVAARTNAWLGKSNYDVDGYFNGTFDEARLSRVARDSNWVRMDYATQRSDSSVVVLGTTVSSKPLYYPQKNAVYIRNAPITANTPVTSGAVTGTFSISPSTLPAGLSFTASTGAISGTPTTVTSQTQFIVTATVGGSPAADTITIAVSAGAPPSAPLNVTAAGGNAQATVSWAAPTSAGATAITGYLARATQDSSKSCAWTTGALSCVITGLTNGTAYTFVVRATNAGGNSPFSAPSSAVTPAGRPTAPLNVTVSQPNKTTLNALISWSAPASTGGTPIVEYYAIASNGQSCFSSPVASPSCTITFATAAAYTFRVYAVSSAGPGDTSAATAPFTPTGILSGYAIHVTGSAKPFTFALTPKAVETTDALTMTISDAYGRAVWTHTVNPKQDRVSQIVWNGRSTTGRAVSAGVYIVRVAAVNGGTTSEFIQKAVEVK
jgi:hypothetical protein